jgi:dihydrofolate reductase
LISGNSPRRLAAPIIHVYFQILQKGFLEAVYPVVMEENPMGKLIMWNMVTLDGFFEGRNKWDLDFHEYGWGEELEQISKEQLNAAEMLVFGRETYTGMANYWTTAEGEIADLMNAIPKVVFSRSLERADWNNTKLIRSDAVKEMIALKKQSAKDIFVFGSAELSHTFMTHKLFDEYRIVINPVILGGGTLLFKPGTEKKGLKLLWHRPLKTGAVIVCYGPS